MFVLAQSLIRKAKKRVIDHLQQLGEYDLTDMDETALTVLAGVKKDGRDVTIVVRPAYPWLRISSCSYTQFQEQENRNLPGNLRTVGHHPCG
jgi:hypothetical protein